MAIHAGETIQQAYQRYVDWNFENYPDEEPMGLIRFEQFHRERELEEAMKVLR
jgi:hypothetical protein